MRRDPVAAAVNDQEQDRQSRGDCERVSSFRGHVIRRGGARMTR
jgi:hypothetical protein